MSDQRNSKKFFNCLQKLRKSAETAVFENFFGKSFEKKFLTFTGVCANIYTSKGDTPNNRKEVFVMTNIFYYLLSGYNAVSAAHNYIFVFNFSGMTYMVKTTAEMLPYICKLDKASRGAGYALRFCPNKSVKALLLSLGATPLCSTHMFDETVASSKYNKGEIAEKLVTEYYGQEWKKDNVPFTVAGDINVNGVEYQIKFEKATFTNEKSLAKLMKKG